MGHRQGNSDHSTEELAQQALEPVARAIAHRRPKDAVHSFLQAFKHFPLPRDVSLVSLVRQVLGKSDAQSLVAALAAFPCPYCNKGFEKCALCEGSGKAESGRDACLTCMGLGGTPCSFCGGSGWATYSFFPAEFRASVATARSRWAIRQAEAPLPKVSNRPGGTPEEKRKQLARQAAELSRALAALRNAIDLSRRMHREPRARPFSIQLFKRCDKAAKKVHAKLSGALMALAEASRQVADEASDAAKQSFERDRASLFEREAKRVRTAGKRRTSLLLSRA